MLVKVEKMPLFLSFSLLKRAGTSNTPPVLPPNSQTIKTTPCSHRQPYGGPSLGVSPRPRRGLWPPKDGPICWLERGELSIFGRTLWLQKWVSAVVMVLLRIPLFLSMARSYTLYYFLPSHHQQRLRRPHRPRSYLHQPLRRTGLALKGLSQER